LTKKRSVGVGAKPSLATLKAPNGEAIDLASLAKAGPLVLIFYRGGWCPYCNVTLKAYADSFADFQGAGATIVAITPELPEKADTTAASTVLPFPIAIDTGNAFARSLGLVFALPPSLRPLYRQIGIDLIDWNGDDTHELPVPATYVIDREGTVRWAFVEADFTQRANPQDVLAAARGLATI
jgi:peroxiredoxin